MKTTLSSYIRQLRNNYNGSPWYGDSLLQKLENVSEAEAFAVPTPGAHSPAQQVAHILVWRRLLLERLKGNNDFQIQVNSAKDWSPAELLRQKSWSGLLAELSANQSELLRLLEAETDELLKRPLPDGQHAFELLLEGVVAHDVYHTGQIGLTLALLRSMSRPLVEKAM